MPSVTVLVLAAFPGHGNNATTTAAAKTAAAGEGAVKI